MEKQTTLKKKVKLHCVKHDITQTEFAAGLGITKGYLSMILNSRRNPKKLIRKINKEISQKRQLV